MATSNTASVSFSLTPQATNDVFVLTEQGLTQGLFANATIGGNGASITFNVMANDLGGVAKTMYSVDDASASLLAKDADVTASADYTTAWESTVGGNQVRIVNGMIEFRLLDSNGMARNIHALDTNETVTDSFVYAIRLANGTLSWASVNVSLSGQDQEATGSFSYTGSAAEGGSLTAALSATDADGAILSTGYQWQVKGEDGSWQDISGAGAATLDIASDQSMVGREVRVVARTVDVWGGTTVITGGPQTIANQDDAATGTLGVSGVAAEGGSLTATLTDLNDADGTVTTAFEWQENIGGTWTRIDGAVGATLALPGDQSYVGKQVRVVATTTDLLGGQTTFTGSAHAIANVNDAPTGEVTVSGVAAEDQVLTASHTLSDEDGLGSVSYQWYADGEAISGATGEQLTLGQAQVGKTITVTASYNDLQGTEESVSSAATDAVANVNDAPTGEVTVSGVAAEDEVLTAANTLDDEDGLGTVSYQWYADGEAISGGTGDQLTLGQAQVGKTITVTASYTDLQGTEESVGSAATAAVANVNDAPTGAVTISGVAAEDQTLTAANTLDDEDGLGTVSYQWYADGQAIAGATGEQLTLGQAQVGKTITVAASYTDGQGTEESVAGVPTAAVANVNDAPTGAVTISGVAAEDQTLTAANTLGDEDGLGTVSYQWYADGQAISGATGGQLTLGQAQVGRTITVTASYTDGQDTAESVGSAPTAAVANVNDAPTGAVTISGLAAEDQVLTASHTLGDEDGLGTISYQWYANGQAISGATGTQLALGQPQVGKTITVKASYDDAQGTAESVDSAPTAAVANVNDAPTGAVTISGVAAEGQVLTATNTLGDEDGLGPIGYQWYANGQAISGATGTQLTLGLAQVGKTIAVTASYTDTQGTAESVGSAATAPVSSASHAPSGADKTIGILEDQPYALSAADFGFSDTDGQALAAVRVSTLPTAGTLLLNGAALSAGALVSVTDINAGNLVFTPALNASGTAYAAFTFQVRDTGASNNEDPTPNTLSFNVTPVNDAPSGTNKTLNLGEDTSYTFTAADFGFTDTADAGQSLAAVKIESLPASGLLLLNNSALGAGTFVTVTDLNAGKLTFVPADNSTASTSFSFRVQDNGGTLLGGINLDPTPNLATFTISQGTSVGNNGLGNNTTYTVSFTGQGDVNISVLDAGGTDLVQETGSVTFGTFRFERFDNNLELTAVSGGKVLHVAMLDEYVTASRIESVSFSSGGQVGTSNGGFTLATAPYAVATTPTGTAANEVLAGSSVDDVLSGAGGKDLLFGSAGNDSLAGGAGNDLLWGGLGRDIFVFAESGSANADTLLDFQAGVDAIQMSASAFAAAEFSGGVLKANQFLAAAGGNAVNGNQHVLYDTGTGALYYDADANGAAFTKVLIAQFEQGGLTGIPAATDFILGA